MRGIRDAYLKGGGAKGGVGVGVVVGGGGSNNDDNGSLTTTASTGKVNNDYLDSVGNKKVYMQNFVQKISGSSS